MHKYSQLEAVAVDAMGRTPPSQLNRASLFSKKGTDQDMVFIRRGELASWMVKAKLPIKLTFFQQNSYLDQPFAFYEDGAPLLRKIKKVWSE